MTTTNKIGVPTGYKGCIIVPVGGGFDVVDRTSGRWMHVPSQRVAKWNATVWTRLRDEFGGNAALVQLPEVKHEIKTKEKKHANK